jgi:hypothetical protein
MTVTDLGLDEEEQRQLRERAAARGTDVTGYLRELVRRDLNHRMTLSEALAPLQEVMAGHGMTEEEALAFFEAERQAMRAERRAARGEKQPGKVP